MKGNKKILSGIFLLGWIGAVHGQEVAGTMLQQIAALRGYIATAREGYQIVEQGLTTIRDIRNGEFQLHRAFFDSLSAVNPVVKMMPEVSEIINTPKALIDQLSKAMTRWSRPWLSKGEMTGNREIYQNFIALGLKNTGLLQKLISDGALKMTDGERISQIEALAERVRALDRSAQSFITFTDRLITQRKQEHRDVEKVKYLYGLP